MKVLVVVALWVGVFGCSGSDDEAVDTTGSGIVVSDEVCVDACDRRALCSGAMCARAIVDVDVCARTCRDDPEAFGAAAILGQTCAEINGELCLDPEVGSSCDCLGSRSEGVDCAGIFECFSTCFADDEECQRACFDLAGSQALEHYNAIVACAEQACDELASPCIEESCAAPLEACLGASEPRAFCLDVCEPVGSDCPVDQFCYRYADGGVCADGDARDATVPARSAPCEEEGDCGDGQRCVLSGEM